MFSVYAAATMTDIKSAARAQITLINTHTLLSMSSRLGNKGTQPAASAVGLGAGPLGGGASGHPVEHRNHVFDIDAIESLADEDDFVAMVGIWASEGATTGCAKAAVPPDHGCRPGSSATLIMPFARNRLGPRFYCKESRNYLVNVCALN